MTTDTTVPTNLTDACSEWKYETSEARGMLALTVSDRDGDVNNDVFYRVREAGLTEFVDALIWAALNLKVSGEGLCLQALAFEAELVKGRPVLPNGVLVPKARLAESAS